MRNVTEWADVEIDETSANNIIHNTHSYDDINSKKIEEFY